MEAQLLAALFPDEKLAATDIGYDVAIPNGDLLTNDMRPFGHFLQLDL